MKSLINTFTITFVSVAMLLLVLDLTIVPALELFYIPFMALFISVFSVLQMLLHENINKSGNIKKT